MQLALQNVAERKRGCGADLREACNVENRVFGRVERDQARAAVGQYESRDRLVEHPGGFRLFQEPFDIAFVELHRDLLLE